MYVCNCNGINEETVAALIKAGAQRPRDIFKACEAKAQCGKCSIDMRQAINAFKATPLRVATTQTSPHRKQV